VNGAATFQGKTDFSQHGFCGRTAITPSRSCGDQTGRGFISLAENISVSYFWILAYLALSFKSGRMKDLAVLKVYSVLIRKMGHVRKAITSSES
jgi:hypothetical protein